jgi:hypothetical protein
MVPVEVGPKILQDRDFGNPMLIPEGFKIRSVRASVRSQFQPLGPIANPVGYFS